MRFTYTTRIAAAGFLLASVALAGCHISSHGKDGKEDVSIDTPLGGLAVKTDPGAVLQRIGLPAYPGATPARESGSNKDSADVNLSFGSFHLRVQASTFETGDDRSKVEDFYRKALTQYSDVIACEHDRPVGQPTKTGLGLTCKSDRHVHTGGDSSAARAFGPELILKAGSPARQHIVSLDAREHGTHFTLVALDLPKSDSSD